MTKQLAELEAQYKRLGEEIEKLKQKPAYPDWVVDESTRYSIDGIGILLGLNLKRSKKVFQL